MKRYDSYKISKIEGIKEVPSHWKSIKLKFIGNLYSGLTGKSGNDFYNEDNPLSRPYINFKNIANNVKINPNQFDLVEIKPNEEQNQVRKGDLFFLMSSENFEDIAKTAVLVDDLNETYLNSFCRGFRIDDKNFTPEFLNYLLLSGHYREILSNEAKGFTRINIQVGKINNFTIYAPFNKEEQTKIASFLDYKTNLIDATIEKKKRLIELLKEKRQAVINEAVTKGLNPNAAMKDSGVEWLGEIPEHWEVVKLKYLIERVETGKTPSTTRDDFFDEGTINWFGPGDFTSLKLNESIRKITKLAVTENCINLYPANSILLIGIGATLGKVAITENECFSNQQINAIIFNNKIEPFFGLYYLDSIKEIIRNESNSSTMAILNQSKTKDLLLLLPPLEEQLSISNMIKIKEFDFQIIREKILEQIQMLQTYRQSLISEAVTGKIDVRDWQINNN